MSMYMNMKKKINTPMEQGVNMSQNIQAYQDQALKSLTVLAHQLAIVKNLNLAKSLMVMISNILKITIPKEDL